MRETVGLKEGTALVGTAQMGTTINYVKVFLATFDPFSPLATTLEFG